MDKFTKDYNRGHLTRHNPMDVKALKLKLRRSDDVCEDRALNRYQSVIGRLLYPASQLRVDVAFHVGYLARAIAKPRRKAVCPVDIWPQLRAPGLQIMQGGFRRLVAAGALLLEIGKSTWYKSEMR
jgi:hypothetical protein